MLALKAQSLEHLVSPLEPEQACAVSCHEIYVLKFKSEQKNHTSLRKVTCII
jgi:hypothetical protein